MSENNAQEYNPDLISLVDEDGKEIAERTECEEEYEIGLTYSFTAKDIEGYTAVDSEPKKVKILSEEKVISLHKLMAEKTGGDFGLRDIGLLSSALESAYATFDGAELYPTIEEKAARIGHSLIANHAFVDGNKRIGIFILLLFLEVNGYGIHPTRVGKLPPQLAAMNITNVNPQLLTIEAAATGKKEHIYHAAMLDPHTASELSLDDIIKMCDALIKAHEEAGYPVL